MTKTFFLSTIYPGAKPYLSDFFESLTTQECEFIFVWDNVDIHNYTDFEIVNKARNIIGSESIIENRKLMIREAIKLKAENLIFGDADDIMPENRVSVINEKLKSHSLVVNELEVFYNDRASTFPLLQNAFEFSGDKTLKNISNLNNRNFMGLTNTACKADLIADIFETIPNESTIYDWPLFYLAMNKNEEVLLTNSTHSLYRQYPNNIASLVNFDEQSVLRGIEIKAETQKLIGSLTNTKELHENAVRLKTLHSTLKNDFEALSVYINTLKKQHHPALLWWEIFQ